MKRQGEPIRDNNIYAVPTLKLLDFHCVKYKIVAGCWAGGEVNTYDLKLSDKIIEKKYYKILFGKWNQIRETLLASFAYFLHTFGKFCILLGSNFTR